MPPVDFRELSADFPELVDGDGKGWLYRHAKNIFRFIRNNPDLVNKQTHDKLSGISKGFTRQWKKRVKQFQVPLFSLNDKGAWTLRFDGILAEALEAGPLRTEEYVLPQSVSDLLDDTDYYRMHRKAKAISKNGGYTPAGKKISAKNLYKTYSIKGARGKKGNFLSYVERCEKEFPNEKSISQIKKRHMQKIHKAICE